MLPDVTLLGSSLSSSAELPVGDPHPGIEVGDLHQAAPLGTVRSYVSAVEDLDRGVGGFVTDHLAQEVRGRLEENVRNPNQLLPGKIAAE